MLWKNITSVWYSNQPGSHHKKTDFNMEYWWFSEKFRFQEQDFHHIFILQDKITTNAELWKKYQ